MTDVSFVSNSDVLVIKLGNKSTVKLVQKPDPKFNDLTVKMLNLKQMPTLPASRSINIKGIVQSKTRKDAMAMINVVTDTGSLVRCSAFNIAVVNVGGRIGLLNGERHPQWKNIKIADLKHD